MDLNSWLVQSNNETMEWCTHIMSDNHHYTYRPVNEIVERRNVALHQVMHHRTHQQEY